MNCEMSMNELLERLKAENPSKEMLYDTAERTASIVSAFHTQRLKIGMTQRDVANATGIKQPMIARIETGCTIPRLDTMEKLLSSVNLSLSVEEKTKVKQFKKKHENWDTVIFAPVFGALSFGSKKGELAI